jgi:tetratricopeptide (TPR) repeat protein
MPSNLLTEIAAECYQRCLSEEGSQMQQLSQLLPPVPVNSPVFAQTSLSGAVIYQARDLVYRGFYEDAILLVKDCRDDQSISLLLVSLFNLKDSAELQNFYAEKVIEMSKQTSFDFITLFLLAKVLKKLKKADSAQFYLTSSITQCSWFLQARILGRITHGISDQLSEIVALAVNQQIIPDIRKYSQVPFVLMLQARQLFLDCKIDEAEKLFEQSILGTFQKSSELILVCSDVYSQILYVKKKSTELTNLAMKCEEIQPKHKKTMFSVACYFLLVEGAKEKAALKLHEAVEIDAEYFEAWMMLGHCYIELRNLPAAVYAYSKAMKTEIFKEERQSQRRLYEALSTVYEILGQATFKDYYKKKAVELAMN